MLSWAASSHWPPACCCCRRAAGASLTHVDRRAVGFALLTAVTICAYSVVDGIGARLRRQSACLRAVAFRRHRAVVLLPYALWRDGREVIPAMRASGGADFAGGAIAGFVLRHRAMGDDARADRDRRLVARNQRAVRRLIGGVVLKEPVRANRIAAALLIVCGLVLIRLQ